MNGVGTSRIDTILMNPPAANLVNKAEQIYATALAFDHTPFKVTFNADKFDDECRTMDKPCKLEMPDTNKLTQKQRDEMESVNNKMYSDIWSRYDIPFEEAFAAKDLNKINTLWGQASEAFLWWICNQNTVKPQGIPTRGNLIPIRMQPVASKACSTTWINRSQFTNRLDDAM